MLVLQLLAEAQVDAKNFDKAIECYKKLVELHQREDPPSYLAIADSWMTCLITTCILHDILCFFFV